VERLSNVVGFRLVLSGPNLDHGPDVANRYRHQLMLERSGGGVKRKGRGDHEFGIRNSEFGMPPTRPEN
jgi:hypothetical protein